MKLGALPIMCIGIAIGLIAWGIGYFRFWMPNLETAKNYATSADTWEDAANQHDKAYEKYLLADKMVQQKEEEWQKIVAVKTPATSLGAGGVDLAVNAWQLVNDSFTFRNSIQTAVNRQLRYGGVKIQAAPSIEQPPVEATRIMSDYYNYPAVPYPVVMWNLGQVQVRGTYEQILANARAWKNMPNYLAMSDGLQLQGTAPVLTGTYNLVLVGYLRGRTLYPTVLEGAKPESGGTGGGGGGGATGQTSGLGGNGARRSGRGPG